MATPFQALVDEIRGLAGAPKVTYPEGSAAHPLVERVLRIKRGEHLPTFGQAEEELIRFPNNILTDQVELKNDAQWVEVYRKYQVLPGPVSVAIAQIGDTGVPAITATRKVNGSTQFKEGELIPGTADLPAINVTSISVASSGITTVTLAANHWLPPGAWVTFDGTNSTPTLDGNLRISGVPAENQLQFAVSVTVAGTTAGTVVPLNPIIRALRSTQNILVNTLEDVMIAAEDVTVYNEDGVSGHRPSVSCWKEYSFPDFLKGITTYSDDGTENTVGDTYAYSQTNGGTFALSIQNGYRGPCRARRLRIFSSGPVSDAVIAAFAPTFVMPSSGSVVVKSQSLSVSANTSNSSNATSFTYKTGTIGPVTTRGAGGSIGGVGGADIIAVLPPSIPSAFYQGDTITLMEQPQKLPAALREVIVWQLEVPYTSGLPPGGFFYAVQDVSYPTGLIADNPATAPAGATSFACAQLAIDTGLLVDSTTGTIHGTASTPHAQTLYTITATLDGKTINAYVYVTIT